MKASLDDSINCRAACVCDVLPIGTRSQSRLMFVTDPWPLPTYKYKEKLLYGPNRNV